MHVNAYDVSESILDDRTPTNGKLVPASHYVDGMPGKVIVPFDEVIERDFLGRRIEDTCNPAFDNCSFNTSEDDYWSRH